MSTTVHGSTLLYRLVSVLLTALFGLTLAVSPVSAPPASAAVSKRVANRAVSVAAAQIGIRYVWGGTSRRGFDCSGLTQYSYRKAGKYLPRTTGEQYRATIHISRRAARRGDLVFVVRGRSVPHVGIYLGNGYMIAAPHAGARVRQQRVSTGHLVFARVR